MKNKNSLLQSLHKYKIEWFLLISLFIFDNFFSYYAVTNLGGKEANFVIAYWVEKYPLLYFACIPIQVGIIYGIERFLVKILSLIFQEKVDLEKIVLRALTLYWILGNSSMNISFLAGYRQSSATWALLCGLALVISTAYVWISVKILNKREKSLPTASFE